MGECRGDSPLCQSFRGRMGVSPSLKFPQSFQGRRGIQGVERRLMNDFLQAVDKHPKICYKNTTFQTRWQAPTRNSSYW